MRILDRLKYVLEVEREHSSNYGLEAVVPSSGAEGDRQSNDSDNDYFDHYYVDQTCNYDDDCFGYIYYPIDDEAKEYFKIWFHL